MAYIKNASTMGFSIDDDYIYKVFIDKDKEIVVVTKEYCHIAYFDILTKLASGWQHPRLL